MIAVNPNQSVNAARLRAAWVAILAAAAMSSFLVSPERQAADDCAGGRVVDGQCHGVTP